MNSLIMDSPARDFTESLLIGNGRLGACVYGEVLREQLFLNESSLWSGSPEEADNEEASEYLEEIRRLLREGKNYEAQRLFEAHFTCKGSGTSYAHGTDVPFGCYQTLGRLNISYFQAVSSGRPSYGDIENYRRELNLEKAVATVSFNMYGKHYKREYMVSHDYQAIFVHLTCSEPGQIDSSIGLSRDERFDICPLDDIPGLCMFGRMDDGKETETGVNYYCMTAVHVIGGSVKQEAQRVLIREADEAWIIITAHTDMHGFMGLKADNPKMLAKNELMNAYLAKWQEILAKHAQWYEPQFKSMVLQLGGKKNTSQTTKELLAQAIEGMIVPELIELYVNYARYLMITSSQQDSLPANLQGIWADEILTPWNGDWHLNAQQMIYWLVEKANLSDCHIPYLKLTEELVEPGRKTAKAYYNAKGWLAHTCTNPWGFTSPCEDASWGSTAGAPAWQCHHLWEHYLYTLDKEYLAWAYPIMQEAMLFYMDNMVENEEGYLITSPSSSPENWFYDEQGRQCALCEGPAYDRELVASLADSCIQAGKILNDTSKFVQKIRQTREMLAPVQIGSDGRIMEWSKEYKEPFPYHRHLSHLWGVYPGNLISKEETPELGEAAEKSLKMRGMTTAGWAVAYRGCLYARLRDGKGAMECFQSAMKYATAYNLMNLAAHCDETNNNPPLLDLEHCRYPFQIDGNQGNATIILMMILDDRLVFEEDGTITVHLYPLSALSSELMTGKVTGLKAKGNVTVNMEWENGKLITLDYQAPEDIRVIVHTVKE